MVSQSIANVKAPVKIDGTFALVEQTPWIQNETIRENILQGKELDKMKYLDTIRKCQLISDFKSFTSGDLSEIG